MMKSLLTLGLVLLGGSSVQRVVCSTAEGSIRSNRALQLSTGVRYYTVERDDSVCPPPNCGGYFLTAFDYWGRRQRTQCADYRWRSKCYVADIDTSVIAPISHGRYDGCNNNDNSDNSDNSSGNDAIDILGGIVGGTFQKNIYPDYPNLPILEAEVAFVVPPVQEEPTSQECTPTCDCTGENDICIFDPAIDCAGCNCETICVSTTPPKCDGIAGTTCPDGLTCVDDPEDDCDPDCGGTDCDGICVSLTNLAESSTCGDLFDVKGDNCSPTCGGNNCGSFCAKMTGSPCDTSFGAEPCGSGLTCVDPLLDGCDLSCGDGVDCPGVCVPEETVFPFSV